MVKILKSMEGDRGFTVHFTEPTQLKSFNFETTWRWYLRGCAYRGKIKQKMKIFLFGTTNEISLRRFNKQVLIKLH